MTETVPPSEGLNPCLREIAIEIPADVVAQESESVMGKYQKLAKLPGFRKGKVPASVIRQRFADELRSDLIEELVPRFFRQEAEKQHLEPVSQPRVTDIEFKEGEPLRFKATFEVMPPIAVSGYDDLRAEKQDVSVSNDELEEELNHLREQRAKYIEVQGTTLAEGDFAEVSFTGMPSDEGGKPITVDEVLVEVGGKNTVREFSENLRGCSSGDERRFDVNYPQDFSDQRLAGKTVTYNVKVKAIKQKELPALDDDLAKAAGDFKSLAELRQRIREELERQKKSRAEHEAKDKLIEQLVERNNFPVPEALVERQVDVRLERGLRALAAQGLRAEDMKKMDLPRLRAGQRDAAVREVRASLLLEKIADAEKLEVSDDEVNQEIDSLAKQMQQTPESVRARLTRDGALDRIRNRIRNEKALDFLYSRSA